MMNMESQVAILNHKIAELQEENEKLKKEARQHRLNETEGMRYKMDYFNTLAKYQELEKTVADLQNQLAEARRA